VTLHLHAGDLGEHTRKTVASVDDHYYILQVGLPRLLAACPGVALQLHIAGSSPFLDCDFHLQVPAPPAQA
jgi:hypothetical protein